MRMVYKNLCPARISASTRAANIWKNSLKNVESDKIKILYETLLDFFQRNDTYFLNKPRNMLHCFSLHPAETRLLYLSTLTQQTPTSPCHMK